MRLSRDSESFFPHVFSSLLVFRINDKVGNFTGEASEAEKRNELSGGGTRTHHQTKNIIFFFEFSLEK